MNVNTLIGKTLARCERDANVQRVNGDNILFETTDGETFVLYHEQDCCEDVRIEDIDGDLADLVGSPLTMAEESGGDFEDGVERESCTWTFYRFATAKGYVTIRWLGESNGYYSEGVDFRPVIDGAVKWR